MMRVNRTRALILAASAGLALAGCAAVGPDYKRPDAGLPDKFEPARPAADAARLVPARWWTLYRDAALDRLVDAAFANSPDMQTAVARIEEADANLRATGATLLPEVDLNATPTRNALSTKTATPLPGTVPAVRNDFKLGLSTSFELDFWGKLRRGEEAARAQALASRYGRDTVALTLGGMVTGAYVQLRSLDAQVKVTGELLKESQATLDLVGIRRKAGYASSYDLAQAQGAVQALQAQFDDLQRQRALAQNALGLLVGQPALALAAGDLGALPVPPAPPAGLPSSLLERRPDVKQAEAQLMAANAKIGVARAMMLPTFSLTAGYGGESQHLQDLALPGARIWNLGTNMLLPIFDNGRLKAQADAVTAQQKQAAAAYRKAAQTAFREVADALVNAEEYARVEKSVDAQRQAARDALKYARARYMGGYSGFLEVLDAERSLNNVELSALRARQSRLNASVDLIRALGGGWQPDAAESRAERKG